MAYTASALSLMLLGFRKPIVLTGQPAIHLQPHSLQLGTSHLGTHPAKTFLPVCPVTLHAVAEAVLAGFAQGACPFSPALQAYGGLCTLHVYSWLFVNLHLLCPRASAWPIHHHAVTSLDPHQCMVQAASCPC